MNTILDNSAITSSKVWLLYEHWAEHRCDRRLPRRSEIGPNRFLPVLPDLFLTAIEHDPFRVRYRLVGTRAVEHAGFDFTGEYLDELDFDWEHSASWYDYYRLACEKMDLVCGHVITPRGECLFEFMILPLSWDGVKVDQCVGIIDYEIRELREMQRLRFPLRHKAVRT